MNRRTPIFVLLALGVHVAVALLLPKGRQAVPARPPEPTTWVELEGPPSGSLSNGVVVGRIAVAAMAPRGLGARVITSTAGHEMEAVLPPTPDTSASSVVEPAPSSIYLGGAGIGLEGPGSFRMGIAKQALPAPDEATVVADNIKHAIMDPIHAHEQQNGTLADGPVSVALEESTRRLAGSPFEGHAVFSVRIDELGLVVSAQVVESSSDRHAWDEVAAHAFNALAQKRIHIPPGSKGISMQVEITSKVVLPSGAAHRVTAQLGGPPDPTSSTLPIVSGQFDLSDIGAHPIRVVGAHVLSESAF